jgi:hypothetical protein
MHGYVLEDALDVLSTERCPFELSRAFSPLLASVFMVCGAPVVSVILTVVDSGSD